MDGTNRIIMETKVEFRDGNRVQGSGVTVMGDELQVQFYHNKARQLTGTIERHGDVHWENGRVWKKVA